MGKLTVYNNDRELIKDNIKKAIFFTWIDYGNVNNSFSMQRSYNLIWF